MNMKMLRIIEASCICVLAPAITQADAGVPMLAVLWPASWIAFIPVVVIEAWIARHIFGITWKPALIRTAIANAASTLVGIPLTWGALAGVEIVVTGGGRAYGLETLPKKLVAVVVQAPWLIPYESDLDWMIPAAAIVLLIPFFFVSVFVERWCFARKNQLDKALVRLWSWKANLVTYGIMEVMLLCALGYGISKHNTPANSAPSSNNGVVTDAANSAAPHIP
jgi:hypothetical protein